MFVLTTAACAADGDGVSVSAGTSGTRPETSQITASSPSSPPVTSTIVPGSIDQKTGAVHDHHDREGAPPDDDHRRAYQADDRHRPARDDIHHQPARVHDDHFRRADPSPGRCRAAGDRHGGHA
jgi:hypothetical protein